MKKIILSIILSIVMVSTAYAGSRMIYEATSTGPGKPLKVDRAKNHNYTCSFLNSTSITAFTVVLQGSIDEKATFSDLSTNAFDATMISQKFGMRHAESRGMDYVRLNITVVTGPDLDADCYYQSGR